MHGRQLCQFLPPSLHRPPPPSCRAGSHTSSSWYLEWGGYLRQGRPGWQDPSLHCFLVAFAALDFERKLQGSVQQGDDIGDAIVVPGAATTGRPGGGRRTAARGAWGRTRMLLGLW